MLSSLSRFVVCTALTCLTALSALAVDRVFLVPSSGSNVLAIVRSANNTVETTIPAPPGILQVVQAPAADSYYLITNRSTSTISVLDALTLQITKTIDLGASANRAVLTPDGRYLMIAAGALYILDTATNTLIPSPIQVGSSPTRIAISGTLPRAYVLGDSGRRIQVIDTNTLTPLAALDVPNVTDIALTQDEGRLLAVHRDALMQFRITDNQLIAETPSKFDFINPTIHIVPDSPEVLIRSSGISPNNTAALIDLDAGTSRDIGQIGADELNDVAIASDRVAYAIRSSDNAIVSIDLTTTGSAPVTALPFGLGARNIDLSANRRTLFVSSLTNANLLTVDTFTGALRSELPLPIAPANHITIEDPSPGPAARIEIIGGNDQFQPPGEKLPVPLSIRVVDPEGLPLSNADVIFNDSAGIGLTIEPQQPVKTNLLGIASVNVTLPDLAPLNAATGRAPSPQLGDELGSAGELAPIPREQDASELLQTILVDVSVSGLTPISLTVNVIRGVGLLKISGDNQLAAENESFPQPLEMLATDDEGRPLPTGTSITLAPFAAACEALTLFTDPNGFATVKCRGGNLPSSNTVLAGTITATIPDFQQALGIFLTTVAFKFSLAEGANQITIEKISGDGQAGPTGETLSEPLRFRLNSNFGGAGAVGITITQTGGPQVTFSPRVLSTLPGRIQEVFVTFGQNAGPVQLRVVASAPGTAAGPPTLVYNLTATGGQPVRMDISGNNQVGNIETDLPIPLRAVVINESNEILPFPAVNWRVIRGQATLTTSSDPTGSTARVRFGGTPGPVEIIAAIGPLQSVFTLTAVPPEPASISTVSGQSQTLTTGTLSDELVVRVSELNNRPAAGAIVNFTGDPNLRLHPRNGAPGNPVQVAADLSGEAAVRVELLGGIAVLGPKGERKNQLANSVTVIASVGGQLSTSFLLNVVGRPPDFASNAIANAATFEGGVVPGSLVSLFGAGLFEGVIGTENAGANISFRGTTVRIGGLPAPLLNLSAGPPEQINMQVPFGLTPGQTTSVEVENNGSRTTVGGVPVFVSQPGIFEIPLVAGGTIGALINASSGGLVTPDTPIAHGQAASLFLTGGGPISPPVQTGSLGPVPPSTMVLPVIVGVDNKGAEVLFKGYAPGFLGLYQVNFFVPSDARCGLRPLNIQVGDVVSPLSTIAILCP